MQLSDITASANKKVVVKSERVREVKRYYLSLYRASLIEMYDKGFISDPTRYDEEELRRNIVDLDIRYLTGIDGRIKISSNLVQYALLRSKDDEDAYEFLEKLYQAVYYKEISDNIDKFYDEWGFSRGDKKKACQNLSRSGAVIASRSGYRIDEGILGCLGDFGKDYDFITIKDRIYNAALEELGLPLDREDSLLVKGLSREEEILCSEIILNGLIPLDGAYAKYLYKWLEKTKWSDGSKIFSQKDGMYDWVIRYKNPEVVGFQKDLLEKLDQQGRKIVSLLSDGFWVVENTATIRVPIGMFCVCSSDSSDVFLSRRNELEGYSGEVVSLDYLLENDINFIGSPIDLYYDDSKKGLFVDIDQTELKYGESWFSNQGASLDFSGSMYESGKYRKGSLEEDLYKALTDSENGELIGNLPTGFTKESFESAKKTVYKGVIKE